MAQAKQKPIGISDRDYDVISFMAKGQGKTLTNTVRDIFDTLFLVASQYHDGFVIEKEICLSDNTVKFTLHGANSFQVGTASEEELEAKKHDLQLEAKEDVAKARQQLELDQKKAEEQPEPQPRPRPN